MRPALICDRGGSESTPHSIYGTCPAGRTLNTRALFTTLYVQPRRDSVLELTKTKNFVHLCSQYCVNFLSQADCRLTRLGPQPRYNLRFGRNRNSRRLTSRPITSGKRFATERCSQSLPRDCFADGEPSFDGSQPSTAVWNDLRLHTKSKSTSQLTSQVSRTRASKPFESAEQPMAKSNTSPKMLQKQA